MRGLIKTSMMLLFEVLAANIRLVRNWAKRVHDLSDPIAREFPVDFGHEELGEIGDIDLTPGDNLEDPPRYLAVSTAPTKI